MSCKFQDFVLYIILFSLSVIIGTRYVGTSTGFLHIFFPQKTCQFDRFSCKTLAVSPTTVLFCLQSSLM